MKILLFLLCLPLVANAANRQFSSSFESVNDFSGFYIVPQNHMGTASHTLATEQRRTGSYSHKGWMWAANPPSTPTQNNNHRGYPTVQLYKTAGGGYRGPVLIEFWVWVDGYLAPGEWLSLATYDNTTSDIWDGVLVNVSDQGIVHLMHVPSAGQAVYRFQTSTVRLLPRTWAKVTTCLDYTPNGITKVWLNDVLVSEAVTGRTGLLTQAHFGLYAPPSMSAGAVYNDDLVIKEGSCQK